MAEELLSAGKVAKALEATPKQVKDAIEKAGVEPDVVKGGCKYYGQVTVKKIKAALNG